MKKLLLSLALLGLAMGAHAAKLGLTDEELAQQILDDLAKMNEEAEAQNTVGDLIERQYVQLRFLDRLNAKTQVIEIPVGQTLQSQHLEIAARSCFVPATAVNSDAIAFLEIHDDRTPEEDFDGYMMASSPALNALEHPRYDVWVVSCSSTAQYNPPEVPPARAAELLNTDAAEIELPDAPEDEDELAEDETEELIESAD